MNEIKCPHCGQSFTVDEAGYAAILSQVRTKEFDKEIRKQIEVVKESSRKENELELNKAIAEKNDEINNLNLKLNQIQSENEQKNVEHDLEIQKAIADKESEIARLNEQIKSIEEKNTINTEKEVAKVVSDKDNEINNLNLKIQQIQSESEQKEIEYNLNLQKAVSEKENEITRLNQQIKSIEESNLVNIENEVSKAVNKKDNEINELQMTIQKLEAEAKQSDSLKELAVTQAVNNEKKSFEIELEAKKQEIVKQKEEIMQLNSNIEKQKLENEIQLNNELTKIKVERDTQKAEFEAKLKAQQEALEYYKDLKSKMSTKMIGETLEQHCENSFNMIRATAFRNAEFGKDNDISEGSKGDYIYREKDPDGNELISIMFEMKNEMDTTATKHKNEDFFSKLDKDRKNKNCEYAVLVSMLEADSDLYNQGIVDVSYDYEKMYVIRPQFFIPMITVLRNAALNSLEYKRQLSEIKNQEIDITHFEERIESFKSAFSRNYDLAGKQFNTAIEEIDKTIDHLEKVKKNLQSSLNNLRLANEKAQNQLTIKALAKDNATMINMFNDLDQ